MPVLKFTFYLYITSLIIKSGRTRDKAYNKCVNQFSNRQVSRPQTKYRMILVMQLGNIG